MVRWTLVLSAEVKDVRVENEAGTVRAVVAAAEQGL